MGLRGVLPPRGTFPIGNLILEPKLRFSKTYFFQNYGVIFFRVLFLVLFSLLNKIK